LINKTPQENTTFLVVCFIIAAMQLYACLILGLPGPTGEKGKPGTGGQKGEMGYKGMKGDEGEKGSSVSGLPGPTGEKGEPGPRGQKGEIGYQGMKGDDGEKGSSGLPGPTGLNGPKGATGQKGVKGDKEERNGGTVYVRWGHDQCPSTAKLVYSGRAGGSLFSHNGGGSDPQCLPLDPTFLRAVAGNARAYMYGAEYQTEAGSRSHIPTVTDYEVPCAVCYINHRSAVYMVPAKYNCHSGWTREYYGYLMAQNSKSGYTKSQYTCVDIAFKSVGSKANNNGLLFYFVEGRCGSLPCPPYDEIAELSCAVCTK